ncbi:hypothetical protein KR032_010113 [Drosophila birchii]|nr:hypothetical protein KR032_010113 [Drosophila birchii]
MPMLSRNLPMMRQMRMLATKATVERGQHTTSPMQKTHGQWPMREENFAVAQLRQQKQPIRNLSNRPVSLVDMGAFRPVTMPDQAYVPALNHRHNLAAAQNASKGRTIRADEQMDRRMEYRGIRQQERRDADRYEAETDAQFAQENLKVDAKADEEHDFETDLEVRSVREAVFGPPDDSDEDNRLRAQADAELLRRVTAQKVIRQASFPPISRKVIQPYNSYRNHRTRWAEFRHGMIYGRNSF